MVETRHSPLPPTGLPPLNLFPLSSASFIPISLVPHITHHGRHSSLSWQLVSFGPAAPPLALRQTVPSPKATSPALLSPGCPSWTNIWTHLSLITPFTTLLLGLGLACPWHRYDLPSLHQLSLFSYQLLHGLLYSLGRPRPFPGRQNPLFWPFLHQPTLLWPLIR